MISMDKQYRTRDGRKVRIYAVDLFSEFSVVGAIEVDGLWFASFWNKNGFSQLSEDHTEDDLIEVKPRIQREYWVNVYSDCLGWAAKTKHEADYECIITGRIACVKITIDCEEGEGL